MSPLLHLTLRNTVNEQDFKYDPALYEFTERDECPAGEVCTVEGDAGVLSENKMPWEEDIHDQTLALQCKCTILS